MQYFCDHEKDEFFGNHSIRALRFESKIMQYIYNTTKTSNMSNNL